MNRMNNIELFHEREIAADAVRVAAYARKTQ